MRPYIGVSPDALAVANRLRREAAAAASLAGITTLLGIAAEQALPFAARRLAEAGAR